MKSRYQSLVPKDKKCSVLVLLFALVPLFTFAAIVSLGISAIPRFSSRTITLNFGDISGKYGAEAISINSAEASAYTFRVVNFSDPNSTKVDVFTSPEKPSLAFVSLTKTFRLESKQSLELPNKRFRKGYNFLMHDEPIYLLPNSSLEYTPTNTANDIQLCLFTQREQYVQFLTDDHFNCPQTFINSTRSSPSILFNISEASLYYVAIEANSNLSEALTINITVSRSYYDTSKLHSFSSSDCNNPLTPGSVCKMKLCDSYLTCQNSATNYVTFLSTEPVLLEYTIFETFWLSWKERIIIFTIAAIFVTVVCITIFVVVVCLCYYRCSKGTRNKSIEFDVITYVPNKSGILCHYDRCCFIWQGAAVMAFILAFITLFIALQFNSAESLSNTTETVTIDKNPTLVGQVHSTSSIQITQIFQLPETVSMFKLPCSLVNTSFASIFQTRKIHASHDSNSSRYGFNYDYSIPLVLSMGSKITYIVSNIASSSPNLTETCLRFILMNSHDAYNEFLNLPDYYNFTRYVSRSDCLLENQNVTFNIEQLQGIYYVGVEIPQSVSEISAIVNVAHTYFELSNSDKECSNLSIKNPNCSIHICNKWTCLNNEQNICIFANSTSPDELTVDTQPVLYGGRVTVYFIIISMILLLLGISTLAFLLIICIYVNCCSTFIKHLASLKKRKSCRSILIIGIFVSVTCLMLVTSLALLLINPWKFSDYAVVANQTGFTMLHQNLSSFTSSEIDVDFYQENGNSSVEIYAVSWNDISVLHETVHNYVNCSSFPCVISKYLYVVRSGKTNFNYTIKMAPKSNDDDLHFCFSIFDDETQYNSFISKQAYQPAKSKLFNSTNSKALFFRFSGADMKKSAAYYFIVLHYAYPFDYLSSFHDYSVQVEVSVNASIGYYRLPSSTKPVLNDRSSEGQSFNFQNGNCILAKYNSFTVTHIYLKNGNLIDAPLGTALILIIFVTAALLIVVFTIIALRRACLNCLPKKDEQESLLESNSISILANNNQNLFVVTQQRLHDVNRSQDSNKAYRNYSHDTDDGFGSNTDATESPITDRKPTRKKQRQKTHTSSDSGIYSTDDRRRYSSLATARRQRRIGYTSSDSDSTADDYMSDTTTTNTGRKRPLSGIKECSITQSATPAETNSFLHQPKLKDVGRANLECEDKVHLEDKENDAGEANFRKTESVDTEQLKPENVLLDQNFQAIKNVFAKLIKLQLQANDGLMHHCDESGVTLIIPEGAVQESATVWFGACMFSDKFKFGDYVPVTPVVWVHIDRKLNKSAELYIPHDVVISGEDNLQQFTILTAHDDDCSDVISFQENDTSKLEFASGLQIFKISSPHFCSNCVAVQKRVYKAIPRRYLIAQADKKNGSRELLVQFIFLCQLQGCRKVVEDQCKNEDFKIVSWKQVTFIGDGQVSLTFEPDNVPGWNMKEDGITQDYISTENVDYYQVMCCENAAEVTEEELEGLKMLEDLCCYPPRFKIQFQSDAVMERSQTVTVRFNQVHPPVKCTILLEGSIELPPSPSSSTSASTGSSIDLLTYENDSLLGDCLYIVASVGDLGKKWFDFGSRLGLTYGQLQDIELTSISFTQCTRKVIINWRDQNRSESWEPLAEALTKIGFNDLAHKVIDNFNLTEKKEPEIKPEDIPERVLNSPPHLIDLVNLVAARIPDKFHLFGTAVGINDGFLRSLYDTYHNPMDRFNAVLNRWKDSYPDTYTWRTVIKVLQSDAIGANGIANDIIKHLKQKFML